MSAWFVRQAFDTSDFVEQVEFQSGGYCKADLTARPSGSAILSTEVAMGTAASHRCTDRDPIEISAL
jgi:hypothetical protein